jgi:hypothetical protein
VAFGEAVEVKAENPFAEFEKSADFFGRAFPVFRGEGKKG